MSKYYYTNNIDFGINRGKIFSDYDFTTYRKASATVYKLLFNSDNWRSLSKVLEKYVLIFESDHPFWWNTTFWITLKLQDFYKNGNKDYCIDFVNDIKFVLKPDYSLKYIDNCLYLLFNNIDF